MKKRNTKLFKRIMVIIAISLFVPIAAVTFTLQSKPQLNETLRSELGGDYITLSKGVTHYELVQPSDSAPIVVLIPGLTVPMAVFKNNIEAIQDAGFATLRYDFYGRGLSDRPLMKYNSSVYAEQTVELLDSLGIDQPVHLVGISLGGAIAAEIASDTPDRFKSITLIGAAIAFSQEEADAKKRAVLMDRLKAFDSENEIDTSLDAYKFVPYIVDQFNYRGAEMAFISLALNESIYNYLTYYEQLAKVETIPMQIIWGENDDNFPYSHGVKLHSMLSRAQFHTIENGGHTPHFGKSEIVNPILIDFFKKSETEYQFDEQM